MRIWLKIKGRLFFPMAYLYLIWQSCLNGLKSIGKRDTVVMARPYQGEPILLVALYEKGALRPDILCLLASAKQRGLYVVCVNTLSVVEPERHAALIDCYIHKYNFGRDFGSYRSGFNYLYAAGLAERCPRLLMLNDSVFYDAQKNDAFLQAMFESPVDVLGATENHEFEHHLGSFCIAMSGAVLRHPRLRDYWSGYRCSDIRTRVIQRGEMGLSKVLRNCASSPEQFRAQFDVTAVSAYLRDNPSELNGLYSVLREDWNPDFPSLSPAAVGQQVSERYLQHSVSPLGVQLTATRLEHVDNVSTHFVHSLDDHVRFLGAQVVDDGQLAKVLDPVVRDEARCAFLSRFIKGSPVHTNSIFLHRMGLPFIKLDGLYRGVFSVRDVETMAAALGHEQKTDFLRLMYARPYGRDTLSGWKRAAFERGMI